tara:strand:- start:867 stop:1364 length:498 start_codon:yes stop_codon:yes gene_type:complete
MKNINYLFILIIIVILSISCWFSNEKIFEGLEGLEGLEDASPESQPIIESSPEGLDKQSNLQETIENYSSSVYQQIKDMIFSKTTEGEKDTIEQIKKNEELINKIDLNENSTDEEVRNKINQLINYSNMKIQKYKTQLDNNIQYGVSVEIDERDKIRSIVNKYLT